MTIQTPTFSPRNRITIHAKNWHEAGRMYGAQVSASARTVLDDVLPKDTEEKAKILEKAARFFDSVAALSRDTPCIISGKHVCADYLETLRGFSAGVGISIAEGTLLQVEELHGCQSLIVQDDMTRNIAILHTEENFDDKHLVSMYRYIETHGWDREKGLPDEIESQYGYAMVSMTVKGESFEYFGYPALCFGGPAFGINKGTQSFVCVDTISPTKQFETNALWANMVVSIVLRLGDTEKIAEFMKWLSDKTIRFYGGYGIHIAQNRGKKISSYEIGGEHCVGLKPKSIHRRSVIAQANYPRCPVLQIIDEITPPDDRTAWNEADAQIYLEMQGRVQRIEQIAETVNVNNAADTVINQLIDALRANPGDIETDTDNEKIQTFTGFLTTCLAGYVVGYFGQNEASVIAGKLIPDYQDNPKIPLWYDGSGIHTDGVVDLLDAARKMIHTEK